MIKIVKYPDTSTLNTILLRPEFDSSNLDENVVKIVNAVKHKGDQALRDFTLQFDGYAGNDLVATSQELDDAEKNISDELKNAIKQAYSNIYLFHKSQQVAENKVQIAEGITCWRKSIAIEKVGLYIPGGTAPLFSTLLMLAIPAKIAGCKRILVCTPPDKYGKINPAILFAAKITGVDVVYKLGGVQAIAAMAYGTQSVDKVYKIFGPGNRYVTCAKQLVSKDSVAIDMPAGPSEVAVLADDSANPAFVAADLLSQAEHGTDSQVVLVSNSQSLIDSVNDELISQLAVLPRNEFARNALENSKAVLVRDIDEGMLLLNEYAPEHLIIATNNAEQLAEKVVNAGSVFIGNYSCESAGDYASGTNHTLPTNGYAKAYSGVSLDSFVKKVTFQQLTAAGLENLSNTIVSMAEAEGLQAHANAVKIRIIKN